MKTDNPHRWHAMTRKALGPIGRIILGTMVLFGLLITGCQSDTAGNDGSTGMLGLFQKKPEALPSTVAPELNAVLRREMTFPHTRGPTDNTGCTIARVDGTPPAARFVDDNFNERRTYDAFRVPGRDGLPPLAIVNGGDVARPRFWELDSDAPNAAFVREVPVQLDPAEKGWIVARASDVGCLPGPWLILGLGYSTGRPFEYVAVFHRETHQVRKISDAVWAGHSIYEGMSGATGSLLDTRQVGPDVVALLYHTEEIRLRAEVYVRKHDHVMIFSPKYPQGIEVLQLGLDDGNATDWLVINKTLWLRTHDWRSTKDSEGMIWSLDLSAVL